MPSGWYNQGIYDVTGATCDLVNGDIKAMLLNASHAFDRDDAYVSDIDANEITAVGYARLALTGLTLNNNTTLDASYWDSNDPVFGPLATGQTVKFMVLFRDTGDDTTSPLLCCW